MNTKPVVPNKLVSYELTKQILRTVRSAFIKRCLHYLSVGNFHLMRCIWLPLQFHHCCLSKSKQALSSHNWNSRSKEKKKKNDTRLFFVAVHKLTPFTVDQYPAASESKMRGLLQRSNPAAIPVAAFKQSCHAASDIKQLISAWKEMLTFVTKMMEAFKMNSLNTQCVHTLLCQHPWYESSPMHMVTCSLLLSD